MFKEVRRKEDIVDVAGDKLQYAQYIEYHYDQGETSRLGENHVNGQS